MNVTEWFSSGFGCFHESDGKHEECPKERNAIAFDHDWNCDGPIWTESCDGFGHLTSLFLWNLHPDGSSPSVPPEISLLSSLSALDLSFNSI